MSILPSLRTIVLAAVGALAVALPLVAAPPAVGSQHQQEGVTPARAGGEDRYHTARVVATLTFETAEVAHLVTGERFPDALAASFGAGTVDGPVLLTLPDAVPQATWDALEELEVQTVVVVGGTDAIGASVAQELSDHGYSVQRVAGEDRYHTAAAVAVRYAQAVGTLEGDRTALLATGENFPDALAGGPVAAAAGFPLLLTPGHTTHQAVNDALEFLAIDRIVVLGGPHAVSSEVVTFYQDRGYTVERFGGDTRQGTAMLVADLARARLGWTADLVLLARGDDFPDALVASVHGARSTAPILLTVSPGTLGDATRSYLDAICPEVEAIRALGGTQAIATPVLADAVEAAEACREVSLVVSEEQITDRDGTVLLTIDEVPDSIEPEPGVEFGGPTHFTGAVLSDDGEWIAVSSAGVAHGYGSLYDIEAGEHHFVAFQFEGSIDVLEWSPDARFALFGIRTPAETSLLKVVDREDIQTHASETGYVVEVDEEADHQPPFAYEFTGWQEPRTLCFTFEATPYCADAEAGDPKPAQSHGERRPPNGPDTCSTTPQGGHGTDVRSPSCAPGFPVGRAISPQVPRGGCRIGRQIDRVTASTQRTNRRAPVNALPATH